MVAKSALEPYCYVQHAFLRFYGTFRPRFFYNPDKPPNPISDFL
jgi:hypothetical protein